MKGCSPNQSAGNEGLPKWAAADRNVEDTDVLVWYTMGHNHLPSLEDWPVMPVANIGFTLKPSATTLFGRPRSSYRPVMLAAIAQRIGAAFRRFSPGPVPDVATWQAMLRNIGFPIFADGQVGPNTRQAVRWFQEAWTFENLAIDAQVGPKTFAALRRCVDEGGRISPNFRMREMKSEGNGWPRMHRDVTRGLERVRAIKGRPLRLVSAYRDPEHNASIPGAAPNSQHIQGRAADISVRYGLFVSEAVSVRAFTGIGRQPGSQLVKHLDVRTSASVSNPVVFDD